MGYDLPLEIRRTSSKIISQQVFRRAGAAFTGDRRPQAPAGNRERTMVKDPLQTKWKLLAAQLREEARRTPCGKARDALMKRVRQLETSATLEGWLTSAGLRPPIDPNQGSGKRRW
jgi:hypothetical protein